MNDIPNGCKDTVIWLHDGDTRNEQRVFVTESGGIGMEYQGRMVVKTVEDWIALAWGDFYKDASNGPRS